MFGEHANFIIPSYAISALVLIAMVIATRITYSKRLTDLKRLEEQGAKRRSNPENANGR